MTQVQPTTSAPPHEPSNDGQYHLPCDRFMWGRLDTALLPPRERRRPSARQLGFLLERFLPVSPGETHVVYHRLDADDTHIVACGLRRSALLALIEDHPDAITLTPDTLPECLTEHVKSSVQRDLTCFNLLTGPFTPPRVRRLQRRLLFVLALGALLAMTIATFGFERRIRFVRTESQRIALALEGVYTRALLEGSAVSAVSAVSGGSGGDVSGGAATSAQQLPPQLRLTAERRRLERTRGAEASERAGEALKDAALDIQELLRRWPSGTHAQTQLIAFTPNSITLRTDLPVDETVQFIDALQPWTGWTRRHPEIINRDEKSHVIVEFVRDVSDQERGGA